MGRAGGWLGFGGFFVARHDPGNGWAAKTRQMDRQSCGSLQHLSIRPRAPNHTTLFLDDFSDKGPERWHPVNFPCCNLTRKYTFLHQTNKTKKNHFPNHLLCSLYLLTMKEMKTSVLTNKHIMLSNNAQQQKNFWELWFIDLSSQSLRLMGGWTCNVSCGGRFKSALVLRYSFTGVWAV